MEPFDRRSGRQRPVIRTGGTGDRPSVRSTSKQRTPQVYTICEGITAALICFMIVFTPWALGTTPKWAIWTMNITAYTLGMLLVAKWLIRRQTGFKPVRWGAPAEEEDSEFFKLSTSKRDPWTVSLAGLTGFILMYTLVSALNPRATFIAWERRFEYHDCISWLPHSYDSASTWRVFWMYLGLACFFWAARDWLLGKTRRERRSIQEGPEGGTAAATAFSSELSRESTELTASAVLPKPTGPARPELPSRMRLLLWVMCINGSIVALEAILQRLSGTNRLLWLALPRFNDTAATQFGPYAYRANAATFFNLIWPVCLGFWLVLRRAARPSLRQGHRVGSGNHLILLPGAVLMAACPIISTSRGGALVAVAAIMVSMGIVLRIARKETLWFRVGTCSLFVLILGISAFLGLKELVPRFQTIFTDQLSRRTEIYENALPMAREFPVYGTGPGTFGSLYQLYRSSITQVWDAYVHDDWLETRITFGWVGFIAILAMLGIVIAHWFWGGGGIPVRWEFPSTIWVALGATLLHAKFDFPFQVYSLLFLFLLLCVMLYCLSRPERV